MAKKSVASLQKKDGKPVKAIKIVKSAKTDSYTFEEKIISAQQAKTYFKK